jgi:hypothetical protein
MLLPVLGTPSALTSWSVNLAMCLADICLGGGYFMAAASRADLAAGWSARNGRAVVLHSDSPTRDLIALLQQANAAVLLVHEPPEDVVGYVAASRRYDLPLCIRFASQSYSTLAGLARHDCVSTLDAGDLHRPVLDAVHGVAGGFFLELDEQRREAICSRLGLSIAAASTRPLVENVTALLPHAREPGGFRHNRTADESNYVAEVLRPYADLLQGDEGRDFIWPTSSFPDWDRPGHQLCGAQDLLGPARVLIAGHAMHLPHGAFTASVEIEIEDNRSGNSIRSDIFAGDSCIASVRAELPPEGIFAFEIAFFCEEPFLPLQLRILLETGAIEGRLLLRRVRFARRDISASADELQDHHV